jgi:hypothetical protein
MPASPSCGLDEARQLARQVDDGVADVGPVKAADKRARLQASPLDHVLARQVVGRRRQRHARHVGKGLVQNSQTRYSGGS